MVEGIPHTKRSRGRPSDCCVTPNGLRFLVVKIFNLLTKKGKRGKSASGGSVLELKPLSWEAVIRAVLCKLLLNNKGPKRQICLFTFIFHLHKERKSCLLLLLLQENTLPCFFFCKYLVATTAVWKKANWEKLCCSMYRDISMPKQKIILWLHSVVVSASFFFLTSFVFALNKWLSQTEKKSHGLSKKPTTALYNEQRPSMQMKLICADGPVLGLPHRLSSRHWSILSCPFILNIFPEHSLNAGTFGPHGRAQRPTCPISLDRDRHVREDLCCLHQK